MKYLLAILASAILACGGSGGDDNDYVGAANVKLEAKPSSIDTGDRMQVKVKISDTNNNDLIIKIRYPNLLDYVLSSSTIELSDEPKDASPSFNSSEGDSTYLVFFIPARSFETADTDKATLQFELEGIGYLKKGELEVDADVDDPLINNDLEFDINQPEFSPEDSITIKVLGED